MMSTHHTPKLPTPQAAPVRANAGDVGAGGSQPPESAKNMARPLTKNGKTIATAATDAASRPKEIGGPKGPEPTRYGDWERDGRCVDF